MNTGQTERMIDALCRIAEVLERIESHSVKKEKERTKEKERNGDSGAEGYQKGSTDRGNIDIEKVREVLLQRKVSRVVMERWKKTYPVDFIVEHILQAEIWLVANPNNAKKNHSRFFSSWLGRAWNDRGKARRIESGASEREIESAISQHFQEEQ